MIPCPNPLLLPAAILSYYITAICSTLQIIILRFFRLTLFLVTAEYDQL